MIHRIVALLAASALVLAAPMAVADSSVQTGYATIHDGSKVYFEVHGEGPKTLFLGPGTAASRLAFVPGTVPDSVLEMLRASRQAFIDGLKDDYRVLLIEYPGDEPKLYTLTPGVVARDYLAIADAAGIDTFAYYGFSWGCVTGLQLALRTNRMEALACGGFPVMAGPYDEMLQISTAISEGDTQLNGMKLGAPEAGRQFRTYYEGLQSFDDHAIQNQLKLPRLNWIGSEDVLTLGDQPLTNMSQALIDNREALEQAGWDVIVVPGHGHLDASGADVALPLIREWLQENYLGAE